MNKKFSTPVKEAISNSHTVAIHFGNDFIGAEHLLLGMMANEGDKTLRSVFEKNKVDLSLLKQTLEIRVGSATKVEPAKKINRLPLNPAAERVIRDAVKEAELAGSREIRTTDLLLAFLAEGDAETGKILQDAGLTYADAKP